MRNPIRAMVVFVLLILLLVNPLIQADVNPVPGRWEKVVQTKPGSRIRVFTKDDAVHEFGYLDINERFLVCANRRKQSVRIEKVSVDKIILDRTGRNVKKGAIVGAPVGTAFAGIFIAQTSPEAIMVLPLGIAIGSAAGMGLFAAKEPGEKVLYISKEAALSEPQGL